MATLLDPRHGFDHWTGTNDLAGSEIAARGGLSKRQWLRVKPALVKLGVISPIRRSIKTGLPRAPGVDVDLQVSDLYRFSTDRLIPWLRDIFDRLYAKAIADLGRAVASGKRRMRELLELKRKRQLIPANLNPVGWARSVAALAKAQADPTATYAADEARAIAFATQLAMKGQSG